MSFSLGLTTVASAKDYFLNCGGVLYKYEEGWFSKKIYYRFEGGWKEWCAEDHETSIIKDKGAVCKIKGGVSSNKNDSLFGVSVAGKQTLDFIMPRFTSQFEGDTLTEEVCSISKLDE